MKNFGLGWGLIIFSALFDSYAAFIVKMKFNELGHFDFSSGEKFLNYVSVFMKSPILVTAVLAFVTAPFLWFLALNRIDLSVGYPVLVGFHLVFIMLFGIFLLGEALTVSKMIGVLLVMVSFYFLSS